MVKWPWFISKQFLNAAFFWKNFVAFSLYGCSTDEMHDPAAG
jgi:hypothetical protein